VEAAQRVRPLPPLWQAVTLFLTAGGLFVAVNQIFSLRFFVGYTLLENRYLYLLLGSFFPQVFLLFPVGRGRAGSVPWYDVVAFLLGMATSFFFAWHGERMIREAWEFRAPPHAVGVGIVLWALLIEASRRVGGWAFALTLLLLSLYPVYAGRLPGPIAGFNLSFTDTIRYHMASVEAILGIPMRVVGTLIIGFIVFGVVLQAAGGGLFFTRLAMALLGTARGGTAKVAILASALFGTMSGSAVANVLSTGSVTIPAMKRTGFRPEDAAAVEANASTGGLITPPVMGATAFVMASVLGIPYLNVAIAASIPAFLYFLSLFLQLDGYAARRGLQGLPRAELPSLPRTLAEGWFYLFALAALVFFLVYLRQEALAPFYASGALILLALLRRETRWTPGRLLAFLESTRGILAELVTVLAAVGLFIGALSVTGVAGTLTNDILFLAGENTLLLLVLGAVVSFVLGLALTITPAYIFLAITLAPAVIKQGLDPIAVHLYILYWAMLSDITPPVALSVVAASGLAGAPLMRSMVEAMRFGAVKYVLPLYFAYHPALVLREPNPLLAAEVVATATLGVALVAYTLQGYLPGVGALKSSPLGWAVRLAVGVGGLLVAFPGRSVTAVGLGFALGAYGLAFLLARWRRGLVAEGRAPAPSVERGSATPR
jgi:TRAP transporter 4TM/12TM fusion protein